VQCFIYLFILFVCLTPHDDVAQKKKNPFHLDLNSTLIYKTEEIRSKTSRN